MVYKNKKAFLRIKNLPLNRKISMWLIGPIVWIIAVFMTWFPLALLSLRTGTFFPDPSKHYLCFIYNIGFHIFWIIVIPIFIVLLLWNYRELKSLREKFIEKINCKDITFSYRKIFFTDFFLIVLPSTFIFSEWIINIRNFDSWWSLGIGGYGVWIVFHILCAVVITIGVSTGSYSIKVANWINENMKNSEILHVEIYHPDGSGGLGWIFRPFLHLLLFCAPLYLVGFGIVIQNVFFFNVDWKNPLVLFNLFWPTYFGPSWVFWAVRSTGLRYYLIKQKNGLLKKISDSISNLLKNTIVKAHQYDYQDSSDKSAFNVKKVTERINLYNQIQKDYPVWPFPKNTLRFVFGIGPIVTFMSSMVVIIKGLIK